MATDCCEQSAVAWNVLTRSYESGEIKTSLKNGGLVIKGGISQKIGLHGTPGLFCLL